MASKSSVGAVHFTLMFFVITTLGFGVAWYMAYGEWRDAVKTEAKAKQDLEAKEKQARQYFDEIDKLKKLIGHEMNEIGEPGAANPDQTTVIGNIEADLRNVGGPDMGSTYAAVVRALRKRIDDLEADLVQSNDNVTRLQQEILATLQDKYSQPVSVAKADTQRANQAKNDAVTDFDEKIKASQQLVAQYAAEVNELRVQNDNLLQDFEDQRKELLRELDLLRQINNRVTGELEKRTNPSFETPDGFIRKVDHTTGLVWINLGSGDDLAPRTSFSVYKQAHHGVGRGEQDIKGAIEVTRIIGEHLAEARILEEDYSQPMTDGDPVYTPVWSPGRKHRFAVVGLIYFNGMNDLRRLREAEASIAAAKDEVRTLEQKIRLASDAFSRELLGSKVSALQQQISDRQDEIADIRRRAQLGNDSDRDQFREIVEAAGGTLDVEVDDDGRISGDGLTVHHKFLVIGDIPDSTLEIDPDKQEKARRISEAHTELTNQARLLGVRVVSLDLFLEWSGYRPQRRLFRPGEGGYNIRGGARGTGVNETPYNFEAAGQTSKLYESGRKSKSQDTSSGQTAKVFGGR